MRKPTKVFIFVTSGIIGSVVLSYYLHMAWTGFEKNKVYSIFQNEAEYTVTKQPKLIRNKKVYYDVVEPSKNLWDWLNLFLGPATIAGLGFWFQSLQEEAKEDKEKEDKAKAGDQQRENALQSYLSDLSILLVDKKLKLYFSKNPSSSSKEMIPTSKDIDSGAALDVVKAKTLSLLRMFENDIGRKSSILCFLADTKLLKELKLDLSNTSLEAANLKRTNLSHTRLQKANISKANMHKAILSEVDLSEADLRDSDLSESYLTKAILVESNLSRTNLSGAHLHRADFCRANLSQTNLSSADIIDTNLTSANLTNSNLAGANLSGANLSKAVLIGANLAGTILTDATNLDYDQLESSLNWEKAIYTESMIDLTTFGLVAKDEEANLARIAEIKQNRSLFL